MSQNWRATAKTEFIKLFKITKCHEVILIAALYDKNYEDYGTIRRTLDNKRLQNEISYYWDIFLSQSIKIHLQETLRVQSFL